MKIAVTYEGGSIFQHFGKTETFKMYEVEDGKIIKSEVVDTNGSGHGALADFLKERKVDKLICGGIGGGAKAALAEAGIELFGGVTGSAERSRYQSYIRCSRRSRCGSECLSCRRTGICRYKL